jgi:hypothetical protein
MSPEKKEVEDRKNQVIRRLIITKLRALRKEKFGPKTVDKFSLTFRVFLLRYLNLNYEFTLDELANELNKTKLSRELKEGIITILTFLTEIKYESKTISREEFKSLLKEAESIVNLATGKVEKEEKEETIVKKRLLFDFLHNIGLVKTEEEKKKQKELERKEKLEEKVKRREEKRKKLRFLKRKEPIILPPPYPLPDIETKDLEELEKREREKEKKKKVKPLEFIPKVEKEIDNVKLIKEKIHKAKAMVRESKLSDAKRIYIEIMKIYFSLEPKKQAEVYNNIKDLYYKRKSKERLSRPIL